MPKGAGDTSTRNVWKVKTARATWGLGAASWPSATGLVSVGARGTFGTVPPGPDVVCRWWTSAITMAISWLQGDDMAVRAHFTEVERVPKALEMTECVSLLDHSLLSKGIPNAGRPSG